MRRWLRRLIFIAALFPLLAFGTAETPEAADESAVIRGAETTEAPESSWVEIDGTVRRVGSDPFSQLVITDEWGNDWYVIEDEQLIAGFEQQRIVVRATVAYRDLTLADGRTLGERRELRAVEVTQAPE